MKIINIENYLSKKIYQFIILIWKFFFILNKNLILLKYLQYFKYTYIILYIYYYNISYIIHKKFLKYIEII